MDKQVDGLQLAEAIRALEAKGFLAHDQVRPGGRVRCGACGREPAASTVAVLAHSRLEGVSDPADEILVAGVRCPGCNATGTLVLPYGPRAPRDEAEVLGQLGFGHRSPGPGASSHGPASREGGTGHAGLAASREALAQRILTGYRRIAVVGASATHGKPAHDVPLLMRERGYEVFAVNPTLTQWEGQPAYPSLHEVPKPIELVDVFRKAEEAPAIARDAVAVGAKAIWLQLGIVSPEARAVAEQGGVDFVDDQCVNLEYLRLREQQTAFPNLAP